MDFTKGERRFQVVDAESLEIIEQFDFAEKLDAAGYSDLSPAIRPMAHTPDERFFYFQLSFLHGFVEYDMEQGVVTRRAALPNLVPDMPRELYNNDSAHHGIAMNGSSSSSCRSWTALWSTAWSGAWSAAGRRCQTWYRICHGSSTSTILRTTALP